MYKVPYFGNSLSLAQKIKETKDKGTVILHLENELQGFTGENWIAKQKETQLA